jgi:uncharacterized membrane protein
LPRAGDQAHALRTALIAAGALGGAAVLAFAVAPGALTDLVFGGRYGSIAPLAAPYVLGMALLGIGRVLAADRMVRGGAKTVVAATTIAAIVQATLIVRLGSSVDAVAAVTIGTTASLAAVLGVVTVSALPGTRDRFAAATRWIRDPAFLAVAGAAFGAFALRLLVTRGLWVDEAISVSQAGLPFGRMMGRLATGDVHPPLHAAVLWVTVRVFGDGEFAVRLPSLVAGVLLVPLLYAVGRELFDRRTGIVAAVLGAASPLAIWYSQEARMYSLYMLFALAALWGQARALRRGGAGNWVLYGVATAALLWTQYFGVLQVAAQQLVFAGALWHRRRAREPIRPLAFGWLAAVGIVVVLVLPLVPFLLEQVAAYAERGTGLTSVPSQAGNAASGAQSGLSIYAVIANLIWATGGYHADGTMAQIAALWPLGMLGALVLLGRRRSPATTTLLMVAAVPLLALFAIGLQRRDLFELRYVAGVVPVLLLLGARAVAVLPPPRAWPRVVAGALAVIVLLGALADQQLNGTNPRLYDFRGALREVATRAEPGDVILYSPEYLDEVIEYYVPGVEARPLSGAAAAAGADRVFLVGSFLDRREIAGSTGDALSDLEHDRRLVDEFRRPQVRVWVFS